MRQCVKEGLVCLCAVEVGVEKARRWVVVTVVAHCWGLDRLPAAAAAAAAAAATEEERCRSDILDA